jgi:Tol biopolymer transport system component
VQGSEGGRASRIYIVDTETGEARPFTPEGVSLYGGAVSPDGKLVAATGPNRRLLLYPTDGAAPRAAPGLESDEIAVRFSADGRSLFVCRWGPTSSDVYRVDLATGRREPWKTFVPADPAGVIAVGPVLLSADGKAYVYSYRRLLDDLYVVSGLR